MGRVYAVVLIFFMCNNVHAQYKKASFLNKSGRTYGIGATEHFLGGGRGIVPGISVSFGADQGQRFIYSTDIELLLPTSFQYTTVDGYDNTKAVAVTGKTKIGLLLGYNFGYYLTNVEATDTKFKPFATIGFHMLATGGIGSYQYAPAEANPAKFIDDAGFNLGIGAGLGCMYSFSETVGIKLNAGYNFETRLKKTGGYEGYTPYNFYPSHPYAGIGIRFTLKGED
jgi:hypothetical protein